MARTAVAAPPRTQVAFDLGSFRSAYATVAKATGGPAHNPTLRSVLVECDGTTVTLSATDHEVGIVARLADRPGAEACRFLLPPTLDGVLRSISKTKGDLAIALDGDALRLSCGSSKWKLQTFDADLHPGVLRHDGGDEVQVEGEALAKAIRRTQFAADPAPLKYALGGVNAEWKEGSLILSATDGRRIASQEVPAVTPGESDPRQGRVIPLRLAGLLSSSFGDPGPVQVSFPDGNRRLVAGNDHITVVGQLLEGRFPIWRQILTGLSRTNRYALAADDLRAAVAQAAAVETSDSRRVDFFFDGDTLLITSPDAEAGFGSATLSIPDDGPKLRIGFHAQQLATVLGLLKDEDICLNLHGKHQPLVIDADGLTYLQMAFTEEKPK